MFIIFTYPPSHVHSPVKRTPALQFHVQDFSQLQSRRMEQALLSSSNVVQYGNQNTIVGLFVLPPTLPEIRELLMNGGCLLPVKAGMNQISLCMFKQSCLRDCGVLQTLFTTCITTMPGFIDLSQTTSLTRQRSSFCAWIGSSMMVQWSVPAVFQ